MSDSDVDIEDEVKDEKPMGGPGDTMRILVATDIHLGYEQSTKRKQEDDSFRSFEEILRYAQEYEVDCILLGGDLFHEAKPSTTHITKCIQLMRQYCLGSKPVEIQFLMDPEVIFEHCAQKTVNYEDPNLNVAIPIFSIHGNHDDPSVGGYGSMDLLSSTGLVNYFGKWKSVIDVTINPIILQKGNTRVAFYGLSYMNDQRLSRVLKDHKLELNRPKEIESMFSMFVLHQNRARHSRNAFVPESSLPEFLDLVIWGHEHECRIVPECIPGKPYVICQPGSSVATSLARGEAEPKHIGLLEVININGEHTFNMTPLKLKSVRPFVFYDLMLNDCRDEIPETKKPCDGVEEFVDNFIENTVLAEAAKQLTGHPLQPLEPLVRLRVFYSNQSDAFEPIGLCQKYSSSVANPNDMIVMRSCSEKTKKDDVKWEDDLDEISEIFNFSGSSMDWNKSVQGGIFEYFKKPEHLNKLTVLSLGGLNEALKRFVETNDNTAIQDLTRLQIKKTVDRLMNKELENDAEIMEEINNYRDERIAKQQEEEDQTREFLQQRQPTKNSTSYASNEDVVMAVSDDENGHEDAPPPPTRGRGRGRGRAAAAAPKPRAPRARGAVKKNQSIFDF